LGSRIYEEPSVRVMVTYEKLGSRIYEEPSVRMMVTYEKQLRIYEEPSVRMMVTYEKQTANLRGGSGILQLRVPGPWLRWNQQ
uniref:Polymerase PB2 n=1 Tax=Echinostoma caproni TaxID=27848 RepID=A0A183BFT3_9TREM